MGELIKEVPRHLLYYYLVVLFAHTAAKEWTMHIWYRMEPEPRQAFLGKISHQTLFWPWYAPKYLFVGLIGLVRRVRARLTREK